MQFLFYMEKKKRWKKLKDVELLTSCFGVWCTFSLQILGEILSIVPFFRLELQSEAMKGRPLHHILYKLMCCVNFVNKIGNNSGFNE